MAAIPDTSTNGLDVKVTDPKILADDFRCTATGPLTQIRIWASWRYDEVPPASAAPCFNLGLWTDVPVSATNGTFSHPGAQLCNWSFGAFQYTNFVYASGVQERFFDPNIPGIIGTDTVIWEYVFDLTTSRPAGKPMGTPTGCRSRRIV